MTKHFRMQAVKWVVGKLQEGETALSARNE